MEEGTVMANLSELPNIGKVLEQDLIKAGIKTPGELKDVGSKEAFLRIWENDSSVCLSELYALEGAVQGLLIAAIALFVISFLQKGDNKQLEKELEDVAAQWMQENFELKQRISELEKAMKMDSPSIEAEQVPDSPKVRELMKKQVITLYTSGIVTSEIAEQSSLPKEEVEKIIEEYLKH